MNILPPIGPVTITSEGQPQGDVVNVDVSLTPGHQNAPARFMFDINIQALGPVVLQGRTGLETGSYWGSQYTNQPWGTLDPGSYHLEDNFLVSPELYETGLHLSIALTSYGPEPFVIIYSNFKLIPPPQKPQYLPIVGMG